MTKEYHVVLEQLVLMSGSTYVEADSPEQAVRFARECWDNGDVEKCREGSDDTLRAVEVRELDEGGW